MSQSLHLIESLETHLDQIRTDLGTNWPGFAARVRGLAPAFEAAQDDIKAAIAVGDLYVACWAREPVMAILRQTADTSSVGHDRRPPPGGTDHGDMMLIQAIVNRYQSLLARLEEIELSEGGQNRPGENTPTTEVSIDRRAHP
jgi:hypothetical protein